MKDRRVLLCLVVVVACGSRPSTEFRGWWNPADGPSFRPCGTNERWLATIGPSVSLDTAMVFIATDSGSAPPPVLDTASSAEPHFAVVLGDTSPNGAYGPDGSYSRELLVRDFLEVPPGGPGDCR